MRSILELLSPTDWVGCVGDLSGNDPFEKASLVGVLVRLGFLRVLERGASGACAAQI